MGSCWWKGKKANYHIHNMHHWLHLKKFFGSQAVCLKHGILWMRVLVLQCQHWVLSKHCKALSNTLQESGAGRKACAVPRVPHSTWWLQAQVSFVTGGGGAGKCGRRVFRRWEAGVPKQGEGGERAIQAQEGGKDGKAGLCCILSSIPGLLVLPGVIWF